MLIFFFIIREKLVKHCMEENFHLHFHRLITTGGNFNCIFVVQYTHFIYMMAAQGVDSDHSFIVGSKSFKNNLK